MDNLCKRLEEEQQLDIKLNENDDLHENPNLFIMKKNSSYIESHKAPLKGMEYDYFYSTDPYAKFLWSREQYILEQILGTYLRSSRIQLLDFACGTGRILSFLEDKVYSSVGVDVSESMLKEAKQKVRYSQILNCDLTQKPMIIEKKFNLITAFRFFLNAEPELRLKAMCSLSKLLSDDGILVFNNHNNRAAPLTALARLRSPARSEKIVKSMSIREMKNLCIAAGLRIVHMYPLGFLNIRRVEPPIILRELFDRAFFRVPFFCYIASNIVAVCIRQSRCLNEVFMEY